MNETLQINPKFEQIIPPLSAEEFAQLEENILKLGKITDPIQVWNGVIIDGHHRHKILKKWLVMFAKTVKSLKNFQEINL